MKRVFIIAICLSLLYAGAVWAIAGCDNLAAAAADHHADGQKGAHHHDDGAAPHHPAGGKIHCANLFGAMVVGTRFTPEAERRVVASLVYRVVDLGSALAHRSAIVSALGPPGGLAAWSPPLYLLLAVIRI